ncbi:MAG: DNA gyrase subunit A [Proteobacteria bacterium]|nr:DNA gyrase subunit A [Pseudomonadota bacterium]
MEGVAKNLISIDIQDEMQASYLDYSMSVIIGRALPDVRDGLKPVHRRILYAMFREGILSNRRYSKCAGVVGEVLKKYHPHGDSAVYDSLVRMAQPWNMRIQLINGQGNFGSVDGDPAAAYRYTECKLTKEAELLLRDIDKDTVNFGLNFDGSTEEPKVLPSAYPNLLVNGSEGIAVGMATKIPPHNLGEVINGLIALIDNPEIDVDGLMEYIVAPDFPTAGFICGKEGAISAYKTGRGKVIMRGRAHFEEIGNNRDSIVIDQLPFQVNKARLVEEIANLVKTGRVEGISALRDESDRSGMRVVVELKRDAIKEVVLNKLFKHTPLQSTFGIHLLAIVNNRPMTLTLKGMLERYLAHRRDITIRRCNFDLRKAKARLHILEALLKALDHLDKIIQLIRGSKSPDEARPKLIKEFSFSEIQAQAILNMRLQRLTGMERNKLEEEQKELLALTKELEAILDSEEELLKVIKEELIEIRDRFQTPRRSQLAPSVGVFSVRDLIAAEEQVLTISVRGYIKRTKIDEYREQKRGGKGTRGMKRRNQDFAQEIFVANTHDDLSVFTRKGRVFKLPVHAIPNTGRDTMGTPIINLIPIDKEDSIASVLAIKEAETEGDLLFCSKKGLIKRTALSEYKKIRTNGLIAYRCAEGDELLTVVKSEESQNILITTKRGLSIRFQGEQIRRVGRASQGVKGIDLRKDDEIAGMIVLEDSSELLLLSVTENGYGKRSSISQYRTQKRGGKGIIDMKTTKKNGQVVGSIQVKDTDRIMLITNEGQVIRIPVHNIRETNRNALGVRLMKVDKSEIVVDIAKVVEDSDDTDSLDALENSEETASVETLENSSDEVSAEDAEISEETVPAESSEDK